MFSDLSQEEFLSIYAGAVPKPDASPESSSSEPLPFPEDMAYPNSEYI